MNADRTLSTERERAEAQYRKCKAVRDVRKRQLDQAERDLAIAADALATIAGWK